MVNITDEPITKKVAGFIVKTKDSSISTIQREFNLGFNKAQLILQTLERLNVVSQIDGHRPRQVLVNENDFKWIW